MDESILDRIVLHAMEDKIEDRLLADERYVEYRDRMAHIEKELKTQQFNSEQKKSIDKLLTTYNECSAYYGEVCYRQGIYDCVELLKEMGVL